MRTIGEKHAMLQDSNFRVSPTTSNETSLFLSQELANTLGMHDDEDMEFILTKSNLFQNLLKIFSFSQPLIYGKNPWRPSVEELKDRLNTMNVFFNGHETTIYKIHGVVQTASRNYFNGLNQKVQIENNFSSFNIRNFLLEKHSIIHFQEDEGRKYIFITFDTEEIEAMDANEASECQISSVDQSLPLNRIFFGAPGTGKSHQLNEEAGHYFTDANIERVTFYPNYSYAQFIGTYKPIMEGKDIAYAYVPGPFMRQWIRAMQNPAVPVLLIVEELNRANAPAVFGDTFQLLDRKNGVSEYSVATSEDLKKYLQSLISENNHASDGKADWEWLPADTKIDSISLPSNLYIWTTMNSADQGVFPLDTAFKRRWDNTYIGLDEKKDVIADRNFHFSGGFYNWDEFRTKINYLLSSCRVNEDKLLGPFFLNPIGLSDEDFVSKFKSKVLMYLYEDAARQCRSSVFAEDDNKKQRTYSEICSAFDQIGAGVFKGIQLTSVSTGTSQNSMVDSNNE